MKVRLVRVRTNRFGKRVESSRDIVKSEVTIGRGTDNDLVIEDPTAALHHAAFVEAPGAVRLVRKSNVAVFLNAAPVETSDVRPGDVATIGACTLRIVEPPAGEDLRIEILTQCAAPAPILAHGPGPLFAVLRRRLTWGLAAALLVVALAPLAVRRAETLPAATLPALLVSAQLWSVGGLSRAHSQIASKVECCSAPEECGDARLVACERCQTCHADAFRAVADERCLACHPAVGSHAQEEPAGAIAHRREVRCRVCHTEHRGDGAVIRRDDRLCTKCHEDLSAQGLTSELRSVGSFAAHPELRASAFSRLGDRGRRRVDLGGGAACPPNDSRPDARDEGWEWSGINFPHFKHRGSVRRLREPGEARLDCSDCHRPVENGTLMSKPTFATNCQGCHALDFGAGNRNEAPHTRPDAVARMVAGYFWSRAFDESKGDFLTAEQQCEEARLPGVRRWANCPGTPGWARELAEAATAHLFGRTRSEGGPAASEAPAGVCPMCHTGMDRTPGAEQVHRVLLLPDAEHGRWMPLARFVHRAHEEYACATCHREAESAQGSWCIMLPAIETCRECHAGESARGRVASACIDCHAFHNRSHGTMASARAERSGSQ